MIVLATIVRSVRLDLVGGTWSSPCTASPCGRGGGLPMRVTQRVREEALVEA